jgi:uncharacterized membrane protein YqiK
MAEVIPHFCTGVGCEALHGGHGETEAVKIAKINRDADVEIARLQRAEVKLETEAAVEQTEAIADASVEVAEVEADAAVDEAVVENEVLEEIVNPEPEPAPVIVVPPEESGDEEISAPPQIEGSKSETGNSNGWWAGYR